MHVSVLSTTRTNSFNDTERGIKVRSAWQEALDQREGIVEARFVVYHNYDGGYTNDYDLSICIEESIKEKDFLEINLNKYYKVFKVEPTLEGLEEAWSQIWELEESEDINRAYETDFELHRADGTIEIHISVN